VPIDGDPASIRALLGRLDDRVDIDVDPTILQLIQSSMFDSSPAWRRLNELARQHHANRTG